MQRPRSFRMSWTCSHPEATASVYDRCVILVNWTTFDFAYVMTKLLTKTVALSEPDGRTLIISDHATYRLLRKIPNLVDDYEALVDAVLMIANVLPTSPSTCAWQTLSNRPPMRPNCSWWRTNTVTSCLAMISISGENLDARQRESAKIEADLFAYQTLAAIAKDKAAEGLPQRRRSTFWLRFYFYVRWN